MTRKEESELQIFLEGELRKMLHIGFVYGLVWGVSLCGILILLTYVVLTK